jgi:hypothetical protein
MPELSHEPNKMHMKKDNLVLEDELRPEYDLKRLRVRRLGPERKSFGGNIVRLEPDVAELFPSADAVNEALRFLVRATQATSIATPQPQPNPLMRAD